MGEEGRVKRGEGEKNSGVNTRTRTARQTRNTEGVLCFSLSVRLPACLSVCPSIFLPQLLRLIPVLRLLLQASEHDTPSGGLPLPTFLPALPPPIASKQANMIHREGGREAFLPSYRAPIASKQANPIHQRGEGVPS